MSDSVGLAFERLMSPRFEGLPAWFWKLVSVFRRAIGIQPTAHTTVPALMRRAARQTPYGEVLDEFGRVEFLPPCQGC
jgi:hypothetical protein